MADDAKQTNGADQNSDKVQTQNQEGAKKILTLSEEEFSKKLQSEADRRVEMALKTAKEKWQTETEARIEKERREAEELGKMNEDEKRKLLEQKREQQLNDREKALMQKEMELQAMKILEEKGLPVSFARMTLGNSAEDTHENITKFEKAFHDAVNKSVADRLKGGSSKADTEVVGKMDMNAIIRRQARR